MHTEKNILVLFLVLLSTKIFKSIVKKFLWNTRTYHADVKKPFFIIKFKRLDFYFNSKLWNQYITIRRNYYIVNNSFL